MRFRSFRLWLVSKLMPPVSGAERLSKGVPGVRVATASVNPGALAAVTAVDVDTGILADATDTVIGNAAPMREARLIQDGCFVSGGTVRVRYKNQSAAAAVGGALTDTFIIFEG